jgi:hypothetical protein
MRGTSLENWYAVIKKFDHELKLEVFRIESAESRRTKSEYKSQCKTNAAQGQPPRAASFVDLSACLPPLCSSGTKVPVRKRSGSATFTGTAADRRLTRSRFFRGLRRLAAQPAQRAGCRGGRNARATGTRSRAFPNFPWQFTLRELPAATSVTAIIVRQDLKGLTFSMNPLCGTMLRPATEKHFALVQKLWTMRLACGSLRKRLNESRWNKGIECLACPSRKFVTFVVDRFKPEIPRLPETADCTWRAPAQAVLQPSSLRNCATWPVR